MNCSPSPAQSPVQPRHMAMLAAGGYPSGRAGLGLGEFPPSPLLYRHGSSALFPGATPAGSLPGVRDLEIKTEPHLPPPGGLINNLSTSNDTTGIYHHFFQKY